MNPRDACRCGHVRSSHAAGGCSPRSATPCACPKFAPAFPVLDAALPTWIVPLRSYRNGLTLVECRHGEAGGGHCPFCRAEPWMTEGHTLAVKRLVFAPVELKLL